MINFNRVVMCVLLITCVASTVFASENGAFVLNISNGNGFLHEDNGIVNIPFYSEYSIFLKNNSNHRVAAKVYIDNEQVSPSGDFVIDAHDSLNLERFVDDINTGRKFKFVPLNHTEVADSSRQENGEVRVEFRLEKINCECVDGSYIITFDEELEWVDSQIFTSTTMINTSVTTTEPNGATISGSKSHQKFYRVDYEFEDDPIVVLRLKLIGVGN